MLVGRFRFLFKGVSCEPRQRPAIELVGSLTPSHPFRVSLMFIIRRPARWRVLCDSKVRGSPGSTCERVETILHVRTGPRL
jgi:hypothetical protein